MIVYIKVSKRDFLYLYPSIRGSCTYIGNILVPEDRVGGILPLSSSGHQILNTWLPSSVPVLLLSRRKDWLDRRYTRLAQICLSRSICSKNTKVKLPPHGEKIKTILRVRDSSSFSGQRHLHQFLRASTTCVFVRFYCLIVLWEFMFYWHKDVW